MPARSERQRRMMCAAAAGKKTKAKGISRASAAEFCRSKVRRKS